MLKFLGRMFGSPGSIDNVVEKVSNGLDKLHFGSQEKAELRAKTTERITELVIDWIKASSGQAVTRRFLAFSLTMLWGVIYGVKTVMSALAPWVYVIMDDQEKAAKVAAAIMESVATLTESAHEMNGAMMLILAFYFAATHIDRVAGFALRQFGSSSNDLDRKT